MYEDNPEIRLVTAIIHQAIDDSFLNCSKHCGKVSYINERRAGTCYNHDIRDNAKRWLLSDSSTICIYLDLIGVNRECFLNKLNYFFSSSEKPNAAATRMLFYTGK